MAIVQCTHYIIILFSPYWQISLQNKKKTRGKEELISGSISTNSEQDSITISSSDEEDRKKDNAPDDCSAARTERQSDDYATVMYEDFCIDKRYRACILKGCRGKDKPVMWLEEFVITDEEYNDIDLLEDLSEKPKYVNGFISPLDKPATKKVS